MMISAFNDWLYKLARKEERKKDALLREQIIQGILEAFDQAPPKMIYIRANSGSFFFLWNVRDSITMLDNGTIYTPYFTAYCDIDPKIPYLTFHIGAYKGKQDLRAKRYA